MDLLKLISWSVDLERYVLSHFMTFRELLFMWHWYHLMVREVGCVCADTNAVLHVLAARPAQEGAGHRLVPGGGEHGAGVRQHHGP